MQLQETTGFSPNGEETRLVERTYDTRGQLASQAFSDPVGSSETWQRTSFVRDDFGNLIEATMADKTGKHRTACWSFALDGIGSFAQGNAVGQIAFSQVDPGTGALLAAVDPNGLVTPWDRRTLDLRFGGRFRLRHRQRAKVVLKASVCLRKNP